MSAPEKEPLITIYEKWIASTVDENGFEIPHGLLLDDEDELTVFALAVPFPDAYQLMLAQIAQRRAKEAIFAFDRYALPGQETELGDLMAGHHFVAGRFRPFIIEYRYEPRLVRPIDWTNAFWNRGLTDELAQAMRGLVTQAAAR